MPKRYRVSRICGPVFESKSCYVRFVVTGNNSSDDLKLNREWDVMRGRSQGREETQQSNIFFFFPLFFFFLFQISTDFNDHNPADLQEKDPLPWRVFSLCHMCFIVYRHVFYPWNGFIKHSWSCAADFSSYSMSLLSLRRQLISLCTPIIPAGAACCNHRVPQPTLKQPYNPKVISIQVHFKTNAQPIYRHLWYERFIRLVKEVL